MKLSRAASLPIVLTLCCFVSPAASAAAPVHLWDLHFGVAAGDASGNAVARDGAGNAIVAGRFTGTVDFGGGALSASQDDVFLAKYDPAGAHVWSRSFGGIGSEAPEAIALDALGNILMTGAFQDTVSFGGGDLGADGINDIFLAKYDASGAHLWSRRIGGAGLENGLSVAADGSNNVILTGHFEGTVDFGGGGLLSAGGEDVFLAKYDANGTHLWSRRFGSTGDDEGRAVALDGSGNVVVCGYFRETVDFDGGGLLSAGGEDVFLAMYDANGTHLWSQRFGGTSNDEGHGVVVDGSDNIVMCGQFRDTVDFGGGGLMSAGSEDVFLAKYDTNGAHLWSRRFGSNAGGDEGRAVAVDNLGNIGLTGIFVGTVDFGGGNLSGTAYSNIFITAYDASGTNLWGQAAGVAGLNFGNAVAIEGADVLATGAFEYGADFGGGFIAATGFTDAYLVSYTDAATGAAATPRGGLSIETYPNPFNPATLIRYVLPSADRAIVSIHDVRGRLVATLVDETQPAGRHTVSWNGTDVSGDGVRSGVYFVRVSHRGSARTEKLVLLK